jgi:hypothetical protein
VCNRSRYSLLFVKLVLHINSAGSRVFRQVVAVCFMVFKCVSIPSRKSNNTSSREKDHIDSITTLHDRAKKQDRYSLKINIPRSNYHTSDFSRTSLAKLNPLRNSPSPHYASTRTSQARASRTSPHSTYLSLSNLIFTQATQTLQSSTTRTPSV